MSFVEQQSWGNYQERSTSLSHSKHTYLEKVKLLLLPGHHFVLQNGSLAGHVRRADHHGGQLRGLHLVVEPHIADREAELVSGRRHLCTINITPVRTQLVNSSSYIYVHIYVRVNLRTCVNVYI